MYRNRYYRKGELIFVTRQQKLKLLRAPLISIYLLLLLLLLRKHSHISSGYKQTLPLEYIGVLRC